MYGSNALHPALKSLYAKFIVLWDIFSFIKTQDPDTDIHCKVHSAARPFGGDSGVFYTRVISYCVMHCRPLTELDD